MKEPSPELNEAMERLKEHFADRLDMGWTRDGKEYVHIYIPILKDNDGNVHYELGLDDWKIELHFEGKDYETKYGKLIDYLKSNNCNKYPNEEWENKYDKCDCYKFQCLSSITKENLCEKVKEFVDFFDRLIEDWAKGGDVELCEYSLDEILKLNLSIPDYQRVYCWDESYVNCLLNDVYGHLWEYKKEHPYRLGTIILHCYKENKDSHYDIIDGQQRLVTLALLLSELGTFSPLLLEEKFASTESEKYIAYNKYLIKNFCDKRIGHDTDKENKKKRKEFCEGLLSKIEFSVLVLKTQSLDLAYTFFSNQNDRGVPLTDYDLLKAHHLRYIPQSSKSDEDDIMLIAQKWDKMIEEGLKNKSKQSIAYKTWFTDYEKTLDICVYRLRKWMDNKIIEGGNRYIKREYEAAPVIDKNEIPFPEFLKEHLFYEPIQGGRHFFSFVEYHLSKYRKFSNTDEYKLLDNLNGADNNWAYREVIEALLFEYYLKFGEQHLADALVAIMRCALQHRYGTSHANYNSILAFIYEKNIARMIARATAPTFFLGEIRERIKEMPELVDSKTKGIKKTAHDNAKGISQALADKLIDSFKELNN